MDSLAKLFETLAEERSPSVATLWAISETLSTLSPTTGQEVALASGLKPSHLLPFLELPESRDVAAKLLDSLFFGSPSFDALPKDSQVCEPLIGTL